MFAFSVRAERDHGGVDRGSLEAFLRLGLSLEAIAKRVGRDPSTVGYWVRKHGLQAVNRDRHAPRGGIKRSELEALIRAGATMAEIAERRGVSLSTVRHWLTRYGLETTNARGRRAEEARAARERGLAKVQMECRHHGVTDFWLEGRGYYRCLRCRGDAVSRRRRKVKETLVREAGGACALCGYARYPGALQFHHLDPDDKAFTVSNSGTTHSIARAREEARKCALLCANCHAEVEAGVTSLSLSNT